MNIKKIKEKALKKLEGNYIIPIIAIIIFILITSLSKLVAGLIYNEKMTIFFNILITGLLYMGLLEIMIKIARGKKVDIMDLFNRSDLFWKCTAITIILASFTLLFGILEFISFKALTTFIIYQTDMNALLSGTMLLIGILLCAAIAAFYAILMISFSQVYFILYENENMPIIDIFNRSIDLMEEHKIDYIIYELSFIGWIIVGILTFGILLLWVTPYMMVANVNFYDELIKLEKKRKEKRKITP